MTQEYVSEYGKRWHVETPRDSIKRYVARQHIATPIAEIVAHIERVIDGSPDCLKFTNAIRKECASYATLCHARNNRLFRYAVRGH